MSEWSIRHARPEDASALRALFQEVFGYDRGAQHHAWKFDHNPAGPPIIVVAEDGDRIVGQHLLWPTRLRVGTEVVAGAQSIDTMTHPRYRGQGMFTRLGQEAMRCAVERDIELLVAFPNVQSCPGFIRSLGWQQVADAPMSVRPLRPSHHHRVPRWAGPAVDQAARLLPRGAQRGIETRPGRPGDPAMAQLLRGGVSSTGCRLDKDAAYLQWRFDDAAGRQYRWVCAYRDGALSAAAVWGIDAQHGHAVLAQLVGIDARSAQAVLAQAIRQAYGAGCPAMVAIGMAENLSPTLRRAIFLRRGSFPLVQRQLSTRALPVDVQDGAAWTIFGADLDTL